MTRDLLATYNKDTHPLRQGFVDKALQLWKIFTTVMTRRKTRMSLCALDDRMLMDIGVSRGYIDKVSQ